jgi:2-polyprenyl-3-methyl-5-hydroxy-6-metoxy-1,4-benzoquinol methylase
MIAPVDIPKAFARWNRKWGAPNGRAIRWPAWLEDRLEDTPMAVRRKGPFAWQVNNGTRAFEYPWAHHAVTKQGGGLNVVEIGGGLSGLQFVLASEGHRVTNVDPGQVEQSWTYDCSLHTRLSEVFRAPVTLVEDTIEAADIPDAFADVLLCISALEHFPDADLAEFNRHVARILKPSGLAVMTVDLFLDVVPFCSSTSNAYGRNVNVHDMLRDASLELVSGNPAELMGFPEFDDQAILANLSRYLRTIHPVLAQCFTAKRAR